VNRLCFAGVLAAA